jgi:hypothetical protein
VRAVTAAAGSAGGVAAVVSGLATLPGWLLVTVVAAVVVPVIVLLGLLLFVPADEPVTRFERIVAALRRPHRT